MYRKRSGQQTLRSAGWQAAKFTAKAADKAAVGLARWATTDHTGLSKRLANMPPMGVGDTARYILVHFLISLAGVLVSGIWIFFLIAVVIPFLLEHM